MHGAEPEEPKLPTEHTLREMAEEDPDMQLAYSVGVEVRTKTEEFTNANIDILELRAIPADEAAEAVTQAD